MTQAGDYTFILMPGTKTRYVPVELCQEDRDAKYELKIVLPKQLMDLCRCEPILVGDENKHSAGWTIENNASCPAFVLIKKNGELIKHV